MNKLMVFVAEGATVSSMDSIKSAMNTAFQNVQSDSLDMVATALPYALGIMAAVLAITIGIKVFKKVTAKS